MNTNTKILNLEITGQTSDNGATIHQCIFMCAGRSHNIRLTTNTIDYEGIHQALLDNPEHEDFFEFMDDDCSIDVAEQDDIKAIAAVINNIDYLKKELAELNIHELGFAVSNAQEAILDGNV